MFIRRRRADISPYAVGFAVFRVLDIAKSWPARWTGRTVHGGMTAAMPVIALWWSLP